MSSSSSKSFNAIPFELWFVSVRRWACEGVPVDAGGGKWLGASTGAEALKARNMSISLSCVRLGLVSKFMLAKGLLIAPDSPPAALAGDTVLLRLAPKPFQP